MWLNKTQPYVKIKFWLKVDWFCPFHLCLQVE